MYEVIADGTTRWRHTELAEVTRVAKLLIRKSLALRVAIWPVPRHHTHPTKVYFHDRYFLMTTATKTVYPVISYKNAEAPHDIQLHRTPYEPEEGRVVWLVTQPNDLLRIGIRVLVEAYNLATGKRTTQFHTRAKGVSQTYKALREWADSAVSLDAPAPAAVPSTTTTPSETTTMASTTASKKAAAPKTKGKKAAASRNAKTVTGQSGRPSLIPLDAKITVLVSENPRRGAARERFALYRTGMLVSTFLEKGGERGDLLWDFRRKFIDLDKTGLKK